MDRCHAQRDSELPESARGGGDGPPDRRGMSTRITGRPPWPRWMTSSTSRTWSGGLYLDPAIVDYITQIVAVTRTPQQYLPANLARLIEYGASPRATIAFCKGGAGAGAALGPKPCPSRRHQGPRESGAQAPADSRIRGGCPERHLGGVDRQHHPGCANSLAMGVLLQEVKAQTLAGKPARGSQRGLRGYAGGRAPVDVSRAQPGVRRSASLHRGRRSSAISTGRPRRSPEVLVKRFVSYRQ